MGSFFRLNYTVWYFTRENLNVIRSVVTNRCTKVISKISPQKHNCVWMDLVRLCVDSEPEEFVYQHLQHTITFVLLSFIRPHFEIMIVAT